MITLRQGQQYDTEHLEFDGWSGRAPEGQSCWKYFEPDGTYTGPDQCGIEPTWTAESVLKSGLALMEHMAHMTSSAKEWIKMCLGSAVDVAESVYGGDNMSAAKLILLRELEHDLHVRLMKSIHELSKLTAND